jgi:hypothetical protein
MPPLTATLSWARLASPVLGRQSVAEPSGERDGLERSCALVPLDLAHHARGVKPRLLSSNQAVT